ncbi:MAG: cadherin-like domain-containing protein [Rhodospirillales bacterium]
MAEESVTHGVESGGETDRERQTLDDLTVLNTESEAAPDADSASVQPGEDADEAHGFVRQVAHAGSRDTDDAIIEVLPDALAPDEDAIIPPETETDGADAESIASALGSGGEDPDGGSVAPVSAFLTAPEDDAPAADSENAALGLEAFQSLQIDAAAEDENTEEPTLSAPSTGGGAQAAEEAVEPDIDDTDSTEQLRLFSAQTPNLAAADVAGDEDTSVALDISASLNDSDGGSESLDVMVEGVPHGAELAYETDTGRFVLTPEAPYAGAGGPLAYTVSPAVLSQLSLTPPENFNGEIELSVTATAVEPGAGAAHVTKAFTVDIAPVNDAPVAADDTAAAAEDAGAVSIDVLANDSDVDGDALSVASVNILNGAEGAAGVNPDGTVFYDTAGGFQSLAAGETAEVRIEYTVDDGAGGTDTAIATVTVTGTNDGPVAAADTASATEDGGAVTFNVLANDADVDGERFR